MVRVGDHERVRDPANLEFTKHQMQDMLEAVGSRIVEHVGSLSRQEACGDNEDLDFVRAMKEPAPEAPVALESILDRYFNEWVHRSFNSASPGFMAYIPGGGVFPAALADLIADTTNRYTGLFASAPALVQLEANVLTWFREWMDFPPSARGLLTTGGSMAGFNAIVCAREHLLGHRISKGTLYVSSQVHHSVVRAAKLAGFQPERVVSVAVDGRFRMCPDALARAMRRDRKRGLVPFLVVSTAGTTNTGAVDPLGAIADLCAREGVWHHVDGAYGAFFYLCRKVRALRVRLAGLPRADSLTLDPHKGLFLPYGTGALLVRDGQLLRNVHAIAAGYLPAAADQEEFYDPHCYGPDLTRSFRGLRVWLTIQMYGTKKLRTAIEEKYHLAHEAAAEVAKIPGITIDAAPELSLFAFHVDGGTVADQNRATLELVRRIARRKRVLISGCWAGDRYLARVCVVSFRTRRAHVLRCVREVRHVVASLVRRRVQRS